MEETTSVRISRALLEIGAVKLNVSKPFTWASGLKSPIYCDNRKTLSFPKVRKLIRQALSEKVKEYYGEAEVVAGVATGAIAHGILAAEELDLPFVYVRSSPKGHGLGNQVEGFLQKGKKVVVIEDLISTGKSSLAAVEALRQSGSDISGMVAIFSYGFSVAEQSFHNAQCSFYTLTNYQTLIQEAHVMGYLSDVDIRSLELWRQNPEQWSGNFLAASQAIKK